MKRMLGVVGTYVELINKIASSNNSNNNSNNGIMNGNSVKVKKIG